MENSINDVERQRVEAQFKEKYPALYAARQAVLVKQYKNEIEPELRTLLEKTLLMSKDLDEITGRMSIMNAAEDFCEVMKTNYLGIKNVFEQMYNQDFVLTEDEYKKMINDTTSKVLSEFIDLPSKPEDPE